MNSKREMLPRWLNGLIGESFYGECWIHESRIENQKSLYCLRCSCSMCIHCIAYHPSHPLLKIRRFIARDMVILNEIENHIDCSFIKPSIMYNEEAIFLKSMHKPGSMKRSKNDCLTCELNLGEEFRYCSLTCKVYHVLMQEIDIKNALFPFDESKFKPSELNSSSIDDSDNEDLDLHQTPRNFERPDEAKMKRGREQLDLYQTPRNFERPGEVKTKNGSEKLDVHQTPQYFETTDQEAKMKKNGGQKLDMPKTPQIFETLDDAKMMKNDGENYITASPRKMGSGRRKGIPHRSPFS